MDELSAHPPFGSSPPNADTLLRQHSEHWRHRDRSGEIIPFSAQRDPWIAFRTYRAISWLRHAERHADRDVDAAFILLWIAFDCSYGSKRQGERPAMRTNFGEVLRHGRDQIYDALWHRFAGPVRVLLADEYLFQPHLDELSGEPTVHNWKEELARRNDEPQQRALPHKERTLSTLDGVFDRLYCLRNSSSTEVPSGAARETASPYARGARSWPSWSPCSLESCWRRERTSGWGSPATTWKVRARSGRDTRYASSPRCRGA